MMWHLHDAFAAYSSFREADSIQPLALSMAAAALSGLLGKAVAVEMVSAPTTAAFAVTSMML